VPGSPAQQPYPAPYAAPPAYHAPATQPQGAAAQPPKKRRIFVNVGTVLYMLVAAALTLLSLASSIGLLG
ncbi:hypothetical protein LJC04_01725, partial [Ruminococcaceae bacterium OttesenSCG-928-O06]|nr:hypothetical protein [Ruminococcaceae bacterium OttesenSCG-928-O06]